MLNAAIYETKTSDRCNANPRGENQPEISKSVLPCGLSAMADVEKCAEPHDDNITSLLNNDPSYLEDESYKGLSQRITRTRCGRHTKTKQVLTNRSAAST